MEDAQHKTVYPQGVPLTDGDGLDLPLTASLQSTDGESVQAFELAEQAAPASAVVGRYQLVTRIGYGGFGEVWKAWDPQLHRHVALKMPRHDRQFSPQILAQFLDEGRKLAHVTECDGVVTVYDAGESDGIPYMVSEFIAGGCLRDRMLKGPPSIEESTALVIEIAKALHSAHLKGLVHRDIKPGNILMKRGDKPVIADFGLAATERDQLHEPHFTVGTYAYISPEQISSGSHLANPQADIYSLGVVLYELLTGRLPFISNSVRDYKEQVLRRPPRPPRTVKDDIPPELERIVLKCLAKEPTQRYTTAGDLAEELLTYRGQTDRRPVAGEIPAPNLAQCRRAALRRWWLGCVSVVILCGVGVVWWTHSETSEMGNPDLPKKISKPVTNAPAPLTFDDIPDKDLKIGRRYKLLLKEPRTLEGPRHGGDGKHYDRISENLSVTTGAASMFRLGAVRRKNFTIWVSMKQVGPWRGSAGIFFGLMGEAGRKRGQMIILLKNTGRNGKAVPVIAARYRILLTRTGFLPVAPIGDYPFTQSVPRPKLDQFQRFEARIKSGRLVRLNWGGKDLEILRSPALNNEFADFDRGEFGLVTWHSGSTVFENAEIRIDGE